MKYSNINKKSKKVFIIIGIILEIALISGISVYATANYLASQVYYTKNNSSTQISVSSALDELYGKIPSGTKTITSNGNYDISDKASVVVNVPTATGLGTTWNYGTLAASSTGGTYNINVGFTPSYFSIVRTDDGNYFSLIYDKAYGTSKMLSYGHSGPQEFNIGERSGSCIMSIGSTVSFRSNASLTWVWFAQK